MIDVNTRNQSKPGFFLIYFIWFDVINHDIIWQLTTLKIRFWNMFFRDWFGNDITETLSGRSISLQEVVSTISILSRDSSMKWFSRDKVNEQAAVKTRCHPWSLPSLIWSLICWLLFILHCFISPTCKVNFLGLWKRDGFLKNDSHIPIMSEPPPQPINGVKLHRDHAKKGQDEVLDRGVIRNSHHDRYPTITGPRSSLDQDPHQTRTVAWLRLHWIHYAEASGAGVDWRIWK